MTHRTGADPGSPIGGGRITLPGAPLSARGAPKPIKMGAKSYRGASMFTSWEGGWGGKFLDLADLV